MRETDSQGNIFVNDGAKLGICIPWHSPFIWTPTFYSILNLDRPRNMRVKHFQGKGWCPAMRHNWSVKEALKWGANLILILGADQVYEEDVIIRLLKHFPKWDMASGLVPTRGKVDLIGDKPFMSAGFYIKSDIPGEDVEWGTVGPDDEPQEIHSIGTGVLMLKSGVFDAHEKPWFYEELDREQADVYGRHAHMDTGFTTRCTVKYGMKMILDTTIKVKHLHTFEIDETYPERFKDGGHV